MAKPEYQIRDEERLERHRKRSQVARANRNLRSIARAHLAISSCIPESDELDQLPSLPVSAVDPADEATSPPSPDDQRTTPSTMRQAPQADGSDVYAFEGGHPFALITDHGYLAYRIPVEHDHILMIPGKTDYLYSSAGVRMPAWRVTLSSEQKKLLSVFESARDVVSDELAVLEQSDRHGNAT